MSSKKKSSPEQAEPDQLTPLECWVGSHGMQLPADTDAAAALAAHYAQKRQ